MGDVPQGSKLLIPLAGEAVLAHTLRAFETTPDVDEIVLVAREEDMARFREVAEGASITKLCAVVRGGETRSESVESGVSSARSLDGRIAAVTGFRYVTCGEKANFAKPRHGNAVFC